MITKQISKLVYILNIVMFIFILWLSYKHYLNSPGKGIDDFLLALSICVLSSSFVVKSLNHNNSRQMLNWLIGGLIFTSLSGAFIFYELDIYVAAISMTQSLFMVFIILIRCNVKKIKICSTVYLVSSLIIAVLPLCAIGLIVFGTLKRIFLGV
ncbi:hypothetical protein [Pedobacter sp.]